INNPDNQCIQKQIYIYWRTIRIKIKNNQLKSNYIFLSSAQTGSCSKTRNSESKNIPCESNVVS
ncbi:MAG: hypothetical protein PHH72_13065, partial [Parabacteroides sp.]|nr:hypothetical protein [Parabacteroides sp.]